MQGNYPLNPSAVPFDNDFDSTCHIPRLRGVDRAGRIHRQIQGTALSDTGKPVAGAWISAVPTRSPGPSQHVLSARDGSFTVSNLPVGTYLLCLQTPASEYLNPCHWSEQPVSVTLAEGQTLTGQRIQAARRAFLRVRVKNPNRRLKPSGGGAKSPPPLLGLWAPSGIFLPLDLTAEDDGGMSFQLLAPIKAMLRLSISANGLEMEDEKHAALPTAGAVLDLQLTPQDAHHKTYVFQIR